MRGKIKSLLLGFVLSLVLMFISQKVIAQPFSEETMKKVEELKQRAKEKKDMPESIPGIKRIGGEELKKWLDTGKKFILLDTRIPQDYEREHIPSAVRLAPDDVLEKGPQAIESLGIKKEDTIVLYCNGVKCWRSPALGLLLLELGYKNVNWYREGLPDWLAKGYPTVEGKEPGTWKKKK